MIKHCAFLGFVFLAITFSGCDDGGGAGGAAVNVNSNTPADTANTGGNSVADEQAAKGRNLPAVGVPGGALHNSQQQMEMLADRLTLVLWRLTPNVVISRQLGCQAEILFERRLQTALPVWAEWQMGFFLKVELLARNQQWQEFGWNQYWRKQLWW
ncbi:MAG: hypothetical protein R3C03_12855 [Pirellulaceae bacterium]